MNILHTVSADPTRTPTFTLFAQPNFYVTGTRKGGYNSATAPVTTNCVLEQPAYAWLYGNVQNDITDTWLGMVGPGVNRADDSADPSEDGSSQPGAGVNTVTWSDHTDIRPTLLALLGLRDDYVPGGRVPTEILRPNVVPQSVHAHHAIWLQLAQVYKQLNAPVGEFGLATLTASTAAVANSSAGDQRYNAIGTALLSLGNERDILAHQIVSDLNASAFDDQPLNEQRAKSQIRQAQSLIERARQLTD